MYGPRSDKGGQCRFDLVGTWPSGFKTIVEVDGDQHFDLRAYHASASVMANDATKEQWLLHATAPLVCMIRVLQQDVWEDRNGWKRYLQTGIETEHQRFNRSIGDGTPYAPRIIRPIAPEYLGGVYEKFRTTTQPEYVRWNNQVILNGGTLP